MIDAANLGFPRIGAKRELKNALEAYWGGRIDAAALRAVGAELRGRHWKVQRDAGLSVIPSNDFSFYDQMLDMTVMLGAVPGRFKIDDGMRPTHPAGTGRAAMEEVVRGAGDPELDLYFAMARGTPDAPAMEMTKWFDTNYHYIVPEFQVGQHFELASTKVVDEFTEALTLGIHTRPVLIGPVTYLMLGKLRDGNADPLSLLDDLLSVYWQVLSRLHKAGADWVQMDEPVLALDLNQTQRRALRLAYRFLEQAGPKLLVACYFGAPGDNLAVAADLSVAGHHFDFVRGRTDVDKVLKAIPQDRVLSLGLVDGRNVWRCNLRGALDVIDKAIEVRGPERLQIAPSCSLLHSPVDLDNERKLDADLRSWMAFAVQKLGEVSTLAKAATHGPKSVERELLASYEAIKSRETSPAINNPEVALRLTQVFPRDVRRDSAFSERRKLQRAALPLPPYPTTTIGSFPQTAEVRKARAANRRGELPQKDYEAFLETEIAHAIRIQEELDIDVLVHGEFERNDMVEYFGEQLAGFAFTEHGWVQSYGSRCVKPPIIYGDVWRPEPMTVRWSAYAQSLTKRPVKGMLTGPVTILQWSFVRDDQPRAVTCRQIAFAIRDEVHDLERAGINLIQIDEPALREGLPLKSAERAAYLQWAVECFRLASSGVRDSTQIHTHMCYCEFNDIMPSIAELDADVISIETSRSDMELLKSFSDFNYPNDIGPGVYDIHSPRCPSVEDMANLLREAASTLEQGQMWVNPDCGLKTRRWEEVSSALANMVAAAKKLRASAT